MHHTATHLLQSALKKILGQETSQAGSLVEFDRLRFDFNFARQLRSEELQEIERLINGWIGDAILLRTKVMPLVEAKSAGAIAMFGEKYGEEVWRYLFPLLPSRGSFGSNFLVVLLCRILVPQSLSAIGYSFYHFVMRYRCGL